MIDKYLYGEMTWPEIRDVAKENRVALLPVAMIEDHGYHLPVDTDVRLCWEVCQRTGALVPHDVVVIPPILHGYSPHHMDFPGSLTVNPDTFINYVLDVCKSLVHHGFRRILIANGHGSNAHLLDSGVSGLGTPVRKVARSLSEDASFILRRSFFGRPGSSLTRTCEILSPNVDNGHGSFLQSAFGLSILLMDASLRVHP